MNEIKVYHSVWKTAVTMLADLLIVALGVMAILKGSTPVIAWFLVVSSALVQGSQHILP